MNAASLPGPRWLGPYARLLGWLDSAAGWLIVAAITVMVSVVSAQVGLRYGFNSSIGWADEVSRLTFVWSMFLAIPLGIRAGAHIGIEILTAKLPAVLRDVLLRIMAMLSTALMLLVCWESALICWEQWDEKMASLEFSAAWFIIALVVGCGHAALHLMWIVLAGRPCNPEHGRAILVSAE
jgi:TRAP-type C4-dicarboxylate transport system permease small subunit